MIQTLEARGEVLASLYDQLTDIDAEMTASVPTVEMAGTVIATGQAAVDILTSARAVVTAHIDALKPKVMN